MKNGNMTIVYAVVALISLLMVVFYLFFEKKKSFRFFSLYALVAVANCGYLMLAVSDSLSAALWANRISYFGCAYAIITMFFIISKVCGLELKRAAAAALMLLSTAAFALAATGGWLDIYYSSVALETVNGVARLVKSYAPAHILYPVYIVVCFVGMVTVIAWAALKKKAVSSRYAVFIAAVVLGNVAVWGIEQLIDVDFEFLSISFVVTEMLLALLSGVVREHERLMLSMRGTEKAAEEKAKKLPPDIEELFRSFTRRVSTLTPTERVVLQYFIEGCSLEDVAERAFISINTVKKHNSNINRKLELRSREELNLYIELFRRAGRLEEIGLESENQHFQPCETQQSLTS